MADTQTPPPLISLLYCSRAAVGVALPQVRELAEQAQRANAQHGISGLLVYGSGVFFQWLEGPPGAVLRLMQRIKADPRHTHVVEVSRHEALQERLFPHWGMELVDPEQLGEVLQDAIATAAGTPREAPLRVLLARVEVARLLGGKTGVKSTGKQG